MNSFCLSLLRLQALIPSETQTVALFFFLFWLSSQLRSLGLRERKSPSLAPFSPLVQRSGHWTQ